MRRWFRRSGRGGQSLARRFARSDDDAHGVTRLNPLEANHRVRASSRNQIEEETTL
jgi:hypothetical protein